MWKERKKEKVVFLVIKIRMLTRLVYITCTGRNERQMMDWSGFDTRIRFNDIS